MKKVKMLSRLVAATLVLCTSVTAFAQGKIFVDLEEVQTDTPSQIVNDRTMVPVRAITEMIGYDVKWVAQSQQVEVYEKEGVTPVIVMKIDTTKAFYQKYNEITKTFTMEQTELDSPATLINDRTFVPLRFISEAVGYTVEYNSETADVYLFSPGYVENQEGEGKGEVVPLTMEEMTYVLDQTTQSWMAMSKEEKEALLLLIARWWEDYDEVVVEDYDVMYEEINAQIEEQNENEADENVFITACEVAGLDKTKFIEE